MIPEFVIISEFERVPELVRIPAFVIISKLDKPVPDSLFEIVKRSKFEKLPVLVNPIVVPPLEIKNVSELVIPPEFVIPVLEVPEFETIMTSVLDKVPELITPEPELFEILIVSEFENVPELRIPLLLIPEFEIKIVSELERVPKLDIPKSAVFDIAIVSKLESNPEFERLPD